ncbi:hypothetical protein QJQ45_012281 [Haematococcus lacustris]|nr:hypothetical protein QJQ45_012281 [Haematococcus lacustris]
MWQRVDLAWGELITGAITGVLEHIPDGLDPVLPLGAHIAAFLALCAKLKPKNVMGHPGPRRRAALAREDAIRAKLSPTELPALETALETPQQSSRDASTWGQKRPRTCLGRGALQQLSMDQQQLQGAQHQLALDQQQLQGAKRQLTLDQEQLQGAQHQLALDQQQLQGAKRQLTLDQEQLQGAQHQLALDQQQLQGAKRQLTLDQELLQGAQHQLALDQKQLQGAKLAFDAVRTFLHNHSKPSPSRKDLRTWRSVIMTAAQFHGGSVQRRWCLVLKDEEVEQCAEPDPDAHRLLRTISGSRAMHAMFFPADGVAPIYPEQHSHVWTCDTGK